MRRHPLTALLVAAAHACWTLAAGPGLVRHEHAGGGVPHVHAPDLLAAARHRHGDGAPARHAHPRRHGHDHDHHDQHHDGPIPHDHAPPAGGPGVAAGTTSGHWHATPGLLAPPRPPAAANAATPYDAAPPAHRAAAPRAPRRLVPQPRAPPRSPA